MKPSLHTKITQKITQNHLKSLTLDIFDTILLHDYWPAELRYYDIAAKWLNILQKTIAPEITTFEILSHRLYARQQLLRQSQPLRIDLWLDIMIKLLCIKYQIQLSSEQHLELLASLISIELQFEINNSKPNQALIDSITAIKSLHPHLKVYFLADSHFTTAQIKTLMEISNITIFDNGISTGDLNSTKRSGDIFDQLAGQLTTDFDLTKNLHIGDQRLPDYLMPIAHGSQAIHYRPLRLRGLRTLIGKATFHLYNFTAHHREKSLYSHSTNHWQTYDLLTSGLYRKWATDLLFASAADTNTNYLLTGNIATKLVATLPDILDQDNITAAPELGRDTILRAFVWLLATQANSNWNAPNLLKLLAAQAGITNRSNLYQLCFPKNYIYSELAINSFTDDEFWSAFLAEISMGDPTNLQLLQNSYNIAIAALPQNYSKQQFVQLSDNNTGWLFAEFAKLHQNPANIFTYILDTQNHYAANLEKIASTLTPHQEKKLQSLHAQNQSLIRQTNLAPDSSLENFFQHQLQQLTAELS